ncbi:MAG: Zn-dependent protease fused to CBS domain [Candidatus Methanohalarchaeum thermophilum]|uniref:Zinc metalloprotease n=1 Tax=Methanohalarchaeum thermophilum TaxID=1903181 RepID=A0A1Q6DUF8_METT1|nr:MAG: Zn-dependent protease fused to CBS domain [Candidatus Methanohalarchaeum thermophilum]
MKISEIWNVPIKLHISFLIILPVFAYLFGSSPYFFAELDPIYAYSLGTVLAVLFFFCVLLHELGHTYVALKSGIEISGITLMIFGGVSSMEELKEDPDTEFRLAIAGPLVSIAIGIILITLNYFLGLPALPFGLIGAKSSIAGIFIGWLGYINLVLAGFNLIPAFPMDGGRVLRSFLARRMSYIEATRKAAATGRAFAFGLGLLGVLLLPQGGIWFILIAAFIYIGASEEEKTTEISKALADKKVRDLMTSEVVTVSPEIYISDLADIIREKKHMGYPVVEDNTLKGIITFSDIKDISKERQYEVVVKDVMTKDLIKINPEEEAYSALKKISREKVGRIPVVENDELVGIITRTDFTTALQLSGSWG